MTRVIVLSDVHGNAIALEAVRKAIAKEKPDLVAVAGDLAINGPDPAGAIDYEDGSLYLPNGLGLGLCGHAQGGCEVLWEHEE